MAHLQEKGWKFLIRIKDGSHGILSNNYPIAFWNILNQ